MSASVFDVVIGQDAAVRKLRALQSSPAHAYMFVGPPGCGKDAAARAFVATKIQGDDDPRSAPADLVMRGIHVDVHELMRSGARISMEQIVDEFLPQAVQSPIEGPYRVLIVHDFHLLQDDVRSAVLKTIEEPAETTLIVLLLDDVPDSLATVSSRCVRVDFVPLPDAVIAQALMADGVDTETAHRAAAGAAGDLDRARVLADDPALEARMELFSRIPVRLDGTASRALDIVAEIMDAVEAAMTPLLEQQRTEMQELATWEKDFGTSATRRKDLEDKHKREQRRYKTDEFRAGLRRLTLAYGSALQHVTESTVHHQTDSYVRAVKKIRDASVALNRNVNERLLFESLLLSLPTIQV